MNWSKLRIDDEVLRAAPTDKHLVYAITKGFGTTHKWIYILQAEYDQDTETQIRRSHIVKAVMAVTFPSYKTQRKPRRGYDISKLYTVHALHALHDGMIRALQSVP